MMEWFVLLLAIIAYYNMDAKINKILNGQNKNIKKDILLFKKLIEKEIQIELDDEYESVFEESLHKGILKELTNEWLVIEVEKKNGRELIYYKLNKIKGVLEIKQ